MGRFGGYYKGEKKKSKKSQEEKASFIEPPSFRLPQIIGRGKKNA